MRFHFLLSAAFAAASILLAQTPLTVVTASLPPADTGVPYQATLEADGGVPPYRWSTLESTAPFSVNEASGVLSGTPDDGNVPGLGWTFLVRDTAGSTAMVKLSVAVRGMAITKPDIAARNLVLGTAASWAFPVKGGTPPYRWTVFSGYLPNGLALEAATGKVSGTPSAAASFEFEIGVEDATGRKSSTGPVLATVTKERRFVEQLPDARLGEKYSENAAVSSALGFWAFSIERGNFPDGLLPSYYDSFVRGYPLAVGTYEYTLVHHGQVDDRGTQAARVIGPKIETTSLTTTFVGASYRQEIKQSGSTAPFRMSLYSGALPPGLDLIDGVVTGTPKQEGRYTFGIHLNDGRRATATQEITLIVGPRLSPLQISPDAPFAAILNTPGVVRFPVSGGLQPYSIKVSGSLPPGLTLSPEGNLSGTPRQAGTFPLNITVRDAAEQSVTAVVPLSVTKALAGPQLLSSGIVNAATYKSGSIAPGEIVTLFGAQLGPKDLVRAPMADAGLPKALAGTRVWIGGIPAPILYTSERQVGIVVPYGITGPEALVEAEYQGTRSLPLTLRTTAATPGLFTASSSGSGLVAALNQDGTTLMESNPSVPGSVVVLFATGLGSMEVPVEDGGIAQPPFAKTKLPVSVFIDNKEASVLYAGSAPGAVNGLIQINAVVPQSARPGMAVPVSLRVGSFTSPAGTTVPIAKTLTP